jgi:uncharacterized protein (TIGR02172 family)
MQLPDPPIAIGFTAEIFAWKQGWILKLFKPDKSRQMVEMEARLARLVRASGLPVPAVGEVIEVNGRFGLEYERVEGVSMLQALVQQPWKFASYARQLAGLQADMHKTKLLEMPSQKEKLARKIRGAEILPENVRRAALETLEGLLDQEWLCHGDFHPNNILLTAHGPVIIDWIDASRGSPLMDVARSTLLFGGGALPPGIPHWVKIVRGWFYRCYLQRYFEQNPINQHELSRWIPVAAAARLDENIYFDERWLFSLARRLLQ